MLEWHSVKESLPPMPPDDKQVSQDVLVWGSIDFGGGTKKGAKCYMIGQCSVHPNSGAFWRAEGWIVDVTYWSALPDPPAGERLVRPPEPKTTTG